MKKGGKYLKQEAVATSKNRPVAMKQSKIKNPVMQTYLTSLLCLVLSVTMFFGTSFAWFTSEVNNEGNEIYIGTLDVGLYKDNNIDLKNGDAKLFDQNTGIWEPGYTALEVIQIVNEGELAFKYEMAFTDGELLKNDSRATDNLSILDVAEFFDVWVHEGDVSTITGTYKDKIVDDENWRHAGSLDDLLSGTVVLSGEITGVEPTNSETMEEKADTYTIALHMSEEATSADVMGKTIRLNVKLIAYQMTDETDDLGNNQYDANIQVAYDSARLNELLTGGNVMMGTDVNIANSDDRITMTGGTLDGNGNTIEYTVTKGEEEPSLGVLTTTGGTIRNLTIDGANAGRAIFSTGLTESLHVSKCTLSGVYAFNLTGTADSEYTINFNDTVFNSWISYADMIAVANFKDCTFNDVLKPYATTELISCTFVDGSLYVTELEEGESIKLVNCKYGEKVIDELIIKKTGGVLVLSDTEQFDFTTITDEMALVWKATT